MNHHSLNCKRELYANLTRKGRELEERRQCELEAKRLLLRTRPPSWWDGTLESFRHCVKANFGDVI